MITPEERKSIIDEAIETAVLRLPAVINELMKEKVAMKKLSDDFMDSNPSFKLHKKIVSSTIEEVESNNPGMQYQDLLDKAKDKIESNIRRIDNVSLNKPDKPTDLKYKDLPDNGEI